MNRIDLKFPSTSLQTDAAVTVLLPRHLPTPFDQAPPAEPPFPVLWLLHGAFDCGDSWLWHTDLAALVEQHGIAVVLPSVGNSFYLDDPDGPAWHTYVAEELPEYLGSILPLSRKREETWIGGLSMGGYGAVCAALEHPERYSKVFSMSGALDPAHAARFVRAAGGWLPAPFRDVKALSGGPCDPAALLQEADPASLPAFRVSCGREDYFFPNSERLCALLDEKGVPCARDFPAGDHDWAFWAAQLPLCVGWLTGNA